MSSKREGGKPFVAGTNNNPSPMGKNAPEDSCLKVDQLSLGLADISLDSAQNDGGDWELGKDFFNKQVKIIPDSIDAMEEHFEKLQQQELEMAKHEEHSDRGKKELKKAGMKIFFGMRKCDCKCSART